MEGKMKPKINLPFKGKYPITFRFGEAPSWYTLRMGYPHNGVDFGLPVGVPVRACDKGVIQYADNFPDSNGLGINIKHSWGISQYWHLSKLSVKQGGVVEKGQCIGHSGDTGFATGPHLHFATKVIGFGPDNMHGWSDPLHYLTEEIQEPEILPIQPQYYRVKIGDSLWKIAAKFYKNGYQWRRIYDANRKTIRDPALIFPLQKLLIP